MGAEKFTVCVALKRYLWVLVTRLLPKTVYYDTPNVKANIVIAKLTVLGVNGQHQPVFSMLTFILRGC